MKTGKDAIASLKVGQVYEGTAKPRWGAGQHSTSTQRRITKIELDKKQIHWEPVGKTSHYDSGKRVLQPISFLQWADQLVPQSSVRQDSDDGGGAIDGGSIGTGF
jgi:hypothetical protein